MQADPSSDPCLSTLTPALHHNSCSEALAPTLRNPPPVPHVASLAWQLGTKDSPPVPATSATSDVYVYPPTPHMFNSSQYSSTAGAAMRGAARGAPVTNSAATGDALDQLASLAVATAHP